MYYYQQHSPNCFGKYCAIFREKFIVCSELLLRFVITDIKIIIRGFTTLLRLFKNHIWFNVKPLYEGMLISR
jgi:hypothetical protein